jgi:allantoicase
VDGVPDPAQLAADATVAWQSLVPRSPLSGDSRNAFAVSCDQRITHVRLRIFPDGGVARLRLHGDVRPAPSALKAGHALDLAALEHGGFVMVCSDMFFGHRQNLILPGRSTHMGDGWETRRRRGPGNDWSIVRLGARGSLERVELDTDHYKGNAPGSVSLSVVRCPRRDADSLTAHTPWQPLLDPTVLQPHARHAWDLAKPVTATHVRLDIYPDGGVARLRLLGRVV